MRLPHHEKTVERGQNEVTGSRMNIGVAILEVRMTLHFDVAGPDTFIRWHFYRSILPKDQGLRVVKFYHHGIAVVLSCTCRYAYGYSKRKQAFAWLGERYLNEIRACELLYTSRLL